MNQASAEMVILMDLAEVKGVLLDVSGRSMRILKPLGEDLIEVAHIRQITGQSEQWQRNMIRRILETL